MQKYLYQDLYELEDKHFWHIAKRRAVSSFIEKYLPSKKAHILDVGCGTGKNMETFKKFGEVWGIDNSKKAIEFCKKRGLRNLKVGDATSTGFGVSSFDLITMLDVLEHTDDNKTLKEIYRILKPGGIVIITVPAYQWMWSQWDNVLHHKRRYTRGGLKKLLTNNRFKPLKISYMNSYLVAPVLLIRSIKKVVSKKNYGSDFQLSNNMINFLFGKVAAAEFLLLKNTSIPFGLSLICIAQKRPRN